MNRTLKYTLTVLTVVLCSISGYSQVNEGGNPLTFENEKINWRFPVIETEAFDLQEMLVEDEINNQYKDNPYRFGKNFVMGKNLNNSGDWHVLPNGDRVWLLGISSPEALSINLSFDQFDLPEGGRLFIYTPDYAHVLGAYTSANNNNNTGFGTYPIPGNQVIVEYYEPAAEFGNSLLQIETVTHAYRDVEKAARGIGDSGACNNNVVCAVGDPWQDQINSVAIIVVNGNGLCTGNMVNNTGNDGHPYFLTANHCLGGSVANWVFRFNFQSTTCATNNVGSFDTVGGPTLLVTNAGSDMALIEINNGIPIPTAYNPFYAGWDASGVNPSSQVAIHHPSGDLKKISFDVDAAGTANFGGAVCWQVFNWEDGTTEPGSSGSPLFDQNQRVIGQLYGGQATCSNNVNDYYGKFDVSFPFLCQWLSPGCATLVIDGYDPLSPSVANDVQLQSIDEPNGSYCSSSVTPEFTARNAGSATLTSFTYTYNVDGVGTQSGSWTGSLASSGTVVIPLPTTSVSDGPHVFNVTVDNPNGTVDENSSNNSGSSNFSTTSSGIFIDLSLLTDDYPGETTWSITDSFGAVVFSGGPYASAQTSYTFSGCLPEGCYTFDVLDSFGDGMQYNGVVGDYTLVDDQGNILAQMIAGGNFGSQATHPFCLTSSGIPGCTDIGACNFDPASTTDDGSCILPQYYIPTDFSTSTTEPMVLVCAGDEPANYILADQACALAQVNDDPFCITTDWDQICVDVYNCCAGAANGCTNAAACNFDPNACPDIALCTFSGCTDPAACNFNAAAGCDDGSCDLPNGCTDVAACNYNAAATCDDGSCAFAVAYYFDGDADGFGDGAPVMLCAVQSNYVLNNTDCDDGNAAVYPNAPSTEEGIDNDCNGLVDPDEEIPSDCLGDMNDDGNRDVADLLIVLGDFGCSGGCIADFNNDGNTNSVDFLAFLGFFGTPCPQ